MTLAEIRAEITKGKPVFVHDAVDLSPEDYATLMLELPNRKAAFERRVKEIETGEECDLTGMTFEPLPRAQAVLYVAREWQAEDKIFVNLSVKSSVDTDRTEYTLLLQSKEGESNPPLEPIEDFDEWLDTFRTWHTPDPDGKKLVDLVSFPDATDDLPEVSDLYRCSVEDILKAKVTEKAIGIPLDAHHLAWFPKSVILGWQNKGRSGYPSGLIIKDWFAEKNIQSGSPYCQIDGYGRML